MIQIPLVSFAVLIISLAISWALIHRKRPWIGLLLGILPMVLMEWWMQWSLIESIKGCIARSCGELELPPDCAMAEFGCSEWSGLSAFIFWVAGFMDLALYIVGTGLVAWLYARRRRKTIEPTAGSRESE